MKPPHRFAEGKPMVWRDGRGLDHARLVFALAQTAHDLGEVNHLDFTNIAQSTTVLIQHCN